MTLIESYHTCTDPLEWVGLYGNDAKFRRFLDPEMNKHPAKMSMRLADKILAHLESLNLIKKGDRIVDFMAGTARTGVVAELHGYNFTGIELEKHFIDLIELNKKALEKETMKSPNWTIIQGDARHLSELLKDKGAGMMSPPYVEQNQDNRVHINETLKKNGRVAIGHVYSSNPSNIGNLKDVGVVSPPYQDMIGQSGGEFKDFKVGISTLTARKYSSNPSNIGNLKDVGVVSPPYENQDSGENARERRTYFESVIGKVGHLSTVAYGASQGQIGNERNETYLQAMLQVYSESYKSGISPLVVVTKNPTRNGKLRRLDLDTISLLEQAGYEIFDYHQAILFNEYEQQTLDGNEKKGVKGQVSFFKRLSLQKGNVAADHEDVIFARRSD